MFMDAFCGEVEGWKRIEKNKNHDEQRIMMMDDANQGRELSPRSVTRHMNGVLSQ